MLPFGGPEILHGNPPLPTPKLKHFLSQFDKIYYSESNWKDHPSDMDGNGMIILILILQKGLRFPFSAICYKPETSTIGPSCPHLFSQWKLPISPCEMYSGIGTPIIFIIIHVPIMDGMAKVPFITSMETFMSLARQDWQKEVLPSTESLPPEHFILKGIPTKALYKEMLLESDNFIAEQLLLQVSDEVFRELNAKKAIEYIKKTYLFDLPDEPFWVDGSGLSRHNLITPRTMISLVEKIYRLMPDDELFGLLPTGGRTGTLKYNYQAPVPYIFAKREPSVTTTVWWASSRQKPIRPMHLPL
jgi:serine-type D-Ala-D-Ala carboxypeptidase/endopeptidase (penicillin-binding protein 4)